ncbi:helix-turn-helix transcriptional regulator [Actinomadura scrupuli]|uniref:helix-turn-helix transcriptional regulator n=1 Tax=Actinomadura scrupuli TaxID=559629 RepID=UPI003D974689
MTDTLDSMVSPVFAGRQAELTVLCETYRAAREGAAGVVLLGGEAGVGKTRLVNEFVARVHGAGSATGRVLVGGCLELSAASLPYSPFTAALRRLVRQIGVEEIAALMPGGNIRDLARLLPGLGESPADPDPDTGRVRLFEQMLTLLERLAEHDPLVLVVEDAHWADRSTRDLLVFLSRNLGHEHVLLLITYRSDELHRRHPLRPLLAELDRVGTVTRLELPRLSRGQVSAQLGGILGAAADPALVEEVYGRSAGIPLFVEAMVGCSGELGSSVPASLRDLLLASVQRLPEETQDVLRTASADGDRVGHELLAAVTGFDERRLTAALRPAVDGNVLVADVDGYAFRHALIREAVHEDLLPGERTRLHRRYAQVLEETPGLSGDCASTMGIALHWLRAHDHERALPAAWRAAAESAAALAYAERLQMIEQVLELWDRVPDAAALVGHDHVDVLELAAEAASACGEAERGLAFVRAALAEIDEITEPERMAVLLMWRAKLRSWRGLPGELEDLHAAERLAAVPGQARARVLARLCCIAMVSGDDEKSLAYGREALAISQAIGDQETEIEAAISLAAVLVGDGDCDGTAVITTRAQAERIGSGRLVLRALVSISDMHEGAGRHGPAIEAAQEGFAIAQRIGLVRSQGPILAANLAESLISVGRWDEALAAIDRALEFNPVPGMRAMLLLVRCTLELARGENAIAQTAIEGHHRTVWDVGTPQRTLPVARLLIDWRLAQEDHNGALDVLDEVMTGPLMSLKPRYTWPVLVAGAQACADVATDPTVLRDDRLLRRADALLTALRDIAGRTAAAGPVTAAHAATFVAETARAGGVLDRLAWDTAAQAWESLGQPYPLARALVRAAEAAAGDGDRTGAALRLGRAAELADRLDARPLRAQVDDLTRRARLRQDEPVPAPAHGLTPRELEVLRLVAEGRSNRDIAQELFISAKTASVHVSNILAKLGVAGRGEAAATAHRLGIFA